MAYATLTQLKADLGINTTDSTRDTQLTEKLDAAAAAIDDYCGRTFTAAGSPATARTLQPRGRIQRTDEGERLLVPDIGSTTDLVIETGSTAAGWDAVTSTRYEVEPTNAAAEGEPYTAILLMSGTWPTSVGTRVRVTARWGWPAVPDVVEQANLLLAARLWKRKDSPEGIIGSAEWGVLRLSRTDPDVVTLLGPLVRNPVKVG
jgi:hypothetical protein